MNITTRITMNKKIIFATIIVLIIIGGPFYLWINKSFRQHNRDSIILKIPIIEYKVPGNLLSDPIIKDYTNKVVEKGSEFVIEPSTLGYLLGGEVGDIKLKLVEIKDDSVVVEVLADKQFDKNFYPRDTVERKELSDNSCIVAFTLVTDSYFEFCFNLEKDNGRIALKYKIQGESTMPRPGE